MMSLFIFCRKTKQRDKEVEINAAAAAADLAVAYAAALGGMATLTGTVTYCTVRIVL